ncbi:Na(+)/H(+) exchanger protein 7-like protein, partial [Dinothrombium tinctorium]
DVKYSEKSPLVSIPDFERNVINITQSKLKVPKKFVIKTNVSKPHEISLINWRWDAVGTYLLICSFLLIAAGVKICYHHSNILNTHVPESCVLIILGILVGLLLYVTNLQSDPHVPKFTSELFFYILLPPIILESAYSLHDKVFFNNIGTILLYAVIGTVMNVFLIGPSLYICSRLGLFGNFDMSVLEILTFSTLISAVDPVAVLAIFQEVNVNKALYFLVFGESLLNDAVVITMYNIWTTFAAADTVDAAQIATGLLGFITVSGGGLVIGIFLGAVTSLITRYTEDIKVVEPLIVVAFAYFAYITAELFHFSGIISLIACGIWQEEYARHNISKKSYTTIKYLTKTLSSVADVIIFIFLGMVLIRDDHIWDTTFVVLTTIFCIIYRFATVFSLTACANYFFQRVRMVNFEEQLLMAYGGLRGAIAFSLAESLDPKHIKQAELFITTTLFIILFTVFVMGSTTKPIVKFLQVQIHVKQEAKLFTEINNKFMETIMAGIEETAGQRSFNYWAQKLNRFNNSYIKNILIRGGAMNATKINVTFDKVIYKDHSPPVIFRPSIVGCEACFNNKAFRNTETNENRIQENEPSVSRIQATQITPHSSFMDRIHVRKAGDANPDYSKALADAFSRSAYYQLSGSFRVVEDREKKISREMEKKNRWVTAKTKLGAMKAENSEQCAEKPRERRVSSALHCVVSAALKREHDKREENRDTESLHKF